VVAEVEILIQIYLITITKVGVVEEGRVLITQHQESVLFHKEMKVVQHYQAPKRHMVVVVVEVLEGGVKMPRREGMVVMVFKVVFLEHPHIMEAEVVERVIEVPETEHKVTVDWEGVEIVINPRQHPIGMEQMV
tara:strand:- start:11 stop:412 length:402 start_codon:yes stop_codon:yes gene_type:complete